MTKIEPHTLPFLPVSQGNFLICTKSKSEERKGMDNDDDYYDELSPDENIVAKYDVWHHMSIYPPQKVDEGWRKTSPDGKLIATGNKQ